MAFHSSWFVQLWWTVEAGVKLIKNHLKKAVDNATLTYEELSTCLTQIEAVLNYRPLCPVSNDPLDLNMLTPGHLLIGQPLLALPEPCLLNVSENTLNLWQTIPQCYQVFWKR